ncbi:MAG: acyl-CoA/acyl-ACP dehydrogenase [Chloroflexi bacterium]|nr:acyl-CoA/acyl-ACP dehydrogenase [Chloroflexota bacterium]
MDFGLNEVQKMVQSSAKEFLARECPKSYVRAMEKDEKGFTTELWQKIADVGWLRLPFPEKYGGDGQDFVTLCALLEEVAKACLPGPYLSTVGLCGIPILEFGSEGLKQEHLPKIASGQRIMSLALTEPNGRYDAAGVEMRATQAGAGFDLNGTKILVPYANSADYFVVAARTGAGRDPGVGVTWLVVPAKARGITMTPLRSIAWDRQYEVVFKNVYVGPEGLLGGVGQGGKIVDRVLLLGATASSALILGGIQAALDITVEYLKNRIAFGRPIGSFQALQHHCANMARDVEGARHITYSAAWRIAEGLTAEREVVLAKAFVSAASQRITVLSHQSHGAIGFTTEYDLQLYTRRNKAYEVTFGDVDYCAEKVAELALR